MREHDFKELVFGVVDEGGRFRAENPHRFRSLLQRFVGREVQVSVERRKDTRTLNQNRYYWGVVVSLLANHFGYTKDELHEALKWRFLRKSAGATWEGLPTVKSTAALDTLAFEDYLEQVRTWALTEHEVKIPLPNEIEIEI